MPGPILPNPQSPAAAIEFQDERIRIGSVGIGERRKRAVRTSNDDDIPIRIDRKAGTPRRSRSRNLGRPHRHAARIDLRHIGLPSGGPEKMNVVAGIHRDSIRIIDSSCADLFHPEAIAIDIELRHESIRITSEGSEPASERLIGLADDDDVLSRIYRKTLDRRIGRIAIER